MSEPLLPSQVRRLRELAEREAEHGIQWTDIINTRVRTLVLAAFAESYTSGDISLDDEIDLQITDYVRTHSEGNGSSWRPAASSWTDVATAQEDSWDQGAYTWEYLDWLQAASIVLGRRASQNGLMSADHEYAFELHFDADRFRARVNDIFLDRRVNYSFVDESLQDRDGVPLHALTIAPTTAALSNDPRFANAEDAYGEALSHLAGHRAGASITAAGSAVQETLRALGTQGDTLGAMIASARTTGFLQGHDEHLVTAYKRLTDWITADRSNRGNAHWATRGGTDDARLAVQICGALILRLMAAEAERNTITDGASNHSDGNDG